MLQRTISYVWERQQQQQLFLSLYFPSSCFWKKGTKTDRKSGSQEKLQLQLRIRMVKGARKKLCVDVASLATSIMAFYSAGKIDSVIEQFPFFFSLSNTHSTLFAYNLLTAPCVYVWVRVRKFNFKSTAAEFSFTRNFPFCRASFIHCTAV